MPYEQNGTLRTGRQSPTDETIEVTDWSQANLENLSEVDGIVRLPIAQTADTVIWQSVLDWDANQAATQVAHSSDTLELATSGGMAPDLHYSFAETSGSTITDQTGNGYDGAVNGDPDLTASGIESTSGIEFVGNAGDHVDMGDIINEAAGTFTFWLQPTRHFNFNAVIDNAVDNNDWEGWIDGSSHQINWRPGSTQITLDTSLSTGTWYHVAFTWEEGNVVEGYIDASLGDSATAPSSFDPASNAHIGQGHSENDPTEAIIDEFRWYDQRLSESQVQTDMDAGATAISGGSYQTSGSLTTANRVF